MLIVVITLLLIGQKSSGKAMVVSVSTDGHYAISSNEDKTIILWNLNNHSYRVVGTNANIYSAYFIPHSHKFIWQDLNNIVHVQNVKGKQLKHFHNFPTYGEVMTSDLKHYFASDVDWNLYSGIGDQQHRIMHDKDGFYGFGKLLNLSLSNNEQYLLSSGAGGNWYDNTPLDKPHGHDNLEATVLWQVKTGQPIQKFPGLQVKSFATISPNSEYVAGADEGGRVILWSKQGKKLHEYGDIYGGIMERGHYVDKHKGPKRPDDFVDQDGDLAVPGVVTLKFITKHSFLRFTYDIPYTILYRINKKWPTKYIKINKTPFPSIDDYERNASIDTSWRAHILVTGQQKQGGIIVYKYNPNKQSLKKVWAPQPKKWQVWWREWI